MKKLFQLIIISLPLIGFSVVNIGDRGIRFDWFLIALLVAVFCFTIRFDRLSICVFFMHLAVAASALVPLMSGSADRIFDFATSWGQFLLGSLLFLVVVRGKYETSDIRWLIKLYIFSGLVVAILAIAQFVASYFGVNLQISFTNAGRVQPHSGYEESTGSFLRSTSFFSEPRQLGIFLLSRFNILFVLIVSRSSILFGNRFGLWVVLIIYALALVTTLSSSTFVLWFVSVVLILLLVLSRSFAKALRSLTLFAALSVLLIFGIQNSQLNEVIGMRFKFIERLEMIPLQFRTEAFRPNNVMLYVSNVALSYRAWQESPIVGVGLNNLPNYSTHSKVVSAHGPFLWVAETGLLGLISLLILILFLAFRLAILIKRIPDYLAGWPLVGLVLIGQPFFLSFASLYTFISTYFWVDAALAAIIYYQLRRFVQSKQSENEFPDDQPLKHGEAKDGSIMNNMKEAQPEL